MATHLPEGLSPDSVDTLTELTAILVKLRTAQAAATSSTTGTSLLGGTSGATPAPAPGAVTGTTPLPSGAFNPGGFSVKELPSATDNLKHKLQRARAAVKTLSDVSRSLEQQQGEIEELEARRQEQLAMLARIKGVGLEQSKGDDGERMVE